MRSNDDAGFRFDLICPTGLKRLAARYDLGSRTYGDDNWPKGMPISSILNHIEMHLNHYKLNGDTAADDDLAAIAWGVFALMHFESVCDCHECRAIFAYTDKQYLEAQQREP
jgi:hypothetical protein